MTSWEPPLGARRFAPEARASSDQEALPPGASCPTRPLALRCPATRASRASRRAPVRTNLRAASVALLARRARADPRRALGRVAHAPDALEHLVDQDDRAREGEDEHPVREGERHDREDAGQEGHVPTRSRSRGREGELAEGTEGL